MILDWAYDYHENNMSIIYTKTKTNFKKKKMFEYTFVFSRENNYTHVYVSMHIVTVS